MSSVKIRKSLIAAGVKNLKKFGYPGVNETNILTDYLYKKFFLSMLKENLGLGFDKEVNQLIEDISK